LPLQSLHTRLMQFSCTFLWRSLKWGSNGVRGLLWGVSLPCLFAFLFFLSFPLFLSLHSFFLSSSFDFFLSFFLFVELFFTVLLKNGSPSSPAIISLSSTFFGAYKMAKNDVHDHPRLLQHHRLRQYPHCNLKKFKIFQKFEIFQNSDSLPPSSPVPPLPSPTSTYSVFTFITVLYPSTTLLSSNIYCGIWRRTDTTYI